MLHKTFVKRVLILKSTLNYFKDSCFDISKRRDLPNATLANISSDFDVKISNVTFDIRVSKRESLARCSAYISN